MIRTVIRYLPVILPVVAKAVRSYQAKKNGPGSGSGTGTTPRRR